RAVELAERVAALRRAGVAALHVELARCCRIALHRAHRAELDARPRKLAAGLLQEVGRAVEIGLRAEALQIAHAGALAARRAAVPALALRAAQPRVALLLRLLGRRRCGLAGGEQRGQRDAAGEGSAPRGATGQGAIEAPRHRRQRITELQAD